MAESWGNHVAIVVDGILRQPNDSGIIITGLLLYKSLAKDHRLSLIFDSHNREKIHYWLIMNGLTEHVGEVYWEPYDSEDTATRRLAQVKRLKVDGPLAVVYESDTEAATALLEASVPTFLYLHPQYTHPDHRPDSVFAPKPWAELLAEKVRQKEAKATDTRLLSDF